MLGIYCRTSKETKNLSIDQQKELGINFCLSHNFEYKLYIDEGKSGFIFNDDAINPFENRPSFTSLINDIKRYEITKVWVAEHTRISRNHYASAMIFNIFETFNIELYADSKLYDLKDPHSQFARQIMDSVSQLERHLIVNRTTRGLHDAINRGKRGHSKFFGYKIIGKDEKGKPIRETIESEINNLKYIYQEFLKGRTLRSIAYEIYSDEKIEGVKTLLKYATKLSRFLQHPEYTGFALNMEGLNIFHKYNRLEIEDISILLDNKYWVRSIPYPEKIVTIEEWIKVIERLHTNKVTKKDQKNKSRSSGKSMVTGIITCSICDSKYFSYLTLYKRKNGEKYYYNYYKHHMAINNEVCNHKPKTIEVKKIDEIFKSFFFFYYIVFNDSNLFVKETLEKMNREILTTENRIKSEEKNVSKIKKQLTTLNNLLSDVEDKNALLITTNKITSLSNESTEKISLIASLKVELEKLYKMYSNTELENTYTNIKDRVLKFFNELETESRRNELLRIIKKCILYNSYLLIDTGNILFIFDTKQNYVFDIKFLENLKKDEIYKKHFIELKNRKQVRLFNDKLILNVNLNRDDKIRGTLFSYLHEKFNIKYNLNNTSNLISFISLRGLYNKDE